MESKSQAKWSTLTGWFSVGILQHGPLPWKRSLSVFFLSPAKCKLNETQNVFFAFDEGERVQFLFRLGDCVVLPKGIEIFLCKGHQNNRPKIILLFARAPSRGFSHACSSRSDDSLIFQDQGTWLVF